MGMKAIAVSTCSNGSDFPLEGGFVYPAPIHVHVLYHILDLQNTIDINSVSWTKEDTGLI